MRQTVFQNWMFFKSQKCLRDTKITRCKTKLFRPENKNLVTKKIKSLYTKFKYLDENLKPALAKLKPGYAKQKFHASKLRHLIGY